MAEPRNDMLPDESQTKSTVIEDAKIEEPVPIVEEVKVQGPPQVKTPSNELVAALREEREMRKQAQSEKKELEEKLKTLESSSHSVEISDDAFSDEGRALHREISGLKGELFAVTENLARREVLAQYPQLKGKESEFDTYRSEYPGLPMDKAAKLYLAENDLLVAPKVRKGLEAPTGGSKVAESTGFSAAEVDRLMKDEPKKFARMLRSGQIDPDKIV